jgi:hypothetical protein
MQENLNPNQNPNLSPNLSPNPKIVASTLILNHKDFDSEEKAAQASETQTPGKGVSTTSNTPAVISLYAAPCLVKAHSAAIITRESREALIAKLSSTLVTAKDGTALKLNIESLVNRIKLGVTLFATRHLNSFHDVIVLMLCCSVLSHAFVVMCTVAGLV